MVLAKFRLIVIYDYCCGFFSNTYNLSMNTFNSLINIFYFSSCLLLINRALAGDSTKCFFIDNAIYGEVIQIQNSTKNEYKVLQIKSNDQKITENTFVLPIEVSKSTQIRSSEEMSSKTNFAPKLGEKLIISFKEDGICLYEANAINLKKFQSYLETSKEKICPLKDAKALGMAMQLAFADPKNANNLLQMLSLEKKFWNDDSKDCYGQPPTYYYSKLAKIERLDDNEKQN